MSSPLPSCYLTPHELMNRYPQVEKLTWNVAKITIFYVSGLLIGKPRTLKPNILESSFLDLITLANKVNNKRIINLSITTVEKHNFLSPHELIEAYPKVVDVLDWNESKVGIFYSCGLLFGHRIPRENKAVIAEDSFLELVDFATVILNGK